jgi:hypothetical protein
MGNLALQGDNVDCQAPFKTHSVTVYDGSNSNRAGITPDGFYSNATDGAPRLYLNWNYYLSMLDSNGAIRINLAIDNSNNPYLTLNGPDNSSRVTVHWQYGYSQNYTSSNNLAIVLSATQGFSYFADADNSHRFSYVDVTTQTNGSNRGGAIYVRDHANQSRIELGSEYSVNVRGIAIGLTSDTDPNGDWVLGIDPKAGAGFYTSGLRGFSCNPNVSPLDITTGQLAVFSNGLGIWFSAYTQFSDASEHVIFSGALPPVLSEYVRPIILARDINPDFSGTSAWWDTLEIRLFSSLVSGVPTTTISRLDGGSLTNIPPSHTEGPNAASAAANWRLNIHSNYGGDPSAIAFTIKSNDATITLRAGMDSRVSLMIGA